MAASAGSVYSNRHTDSDSQKRRGTTTVNASAVPAHLRGQEVDVRWVMRELLDEQRVTR